MDNKIKVGSLIKFEWDKGNKDKNVKKHKVRNTESEEIFLNDPVIVYDETHSQKENRFLAYGLTNKGRGLVISFTIRGDKKDTIRIVSSRDQDKKEKQFYETNKDK